MVQTSALRGNPGVIANSSPYFDPIRSSLFRAQFYFDRSRDWERMARDELCALASFHSGRFAIYLLSVLSVRRDRTELCPAARPDVRVRDPLPECGPAARTTH